MEKEELILNAKNFREVLTIVHIILQKKMFTVGEEWLKLMLSI